MASSDNFYVPEGGPLDQGDILIAPLCRPISLSAPSLEGFEGQPDLGGVKGKISSRPYEVLHKVQAAMVVSHGCHLDKQYNQSVDWLHRKQNVPLKEARVRAASDPNLDRWIVVSPIFPLQHLKSDPKAIEDNEVIGLLYLPIHPNGLFSEPGVVDLSLKFTVDRELTKRVSCLTPLARDNVAMSLLRVDLARKPTWSLLESALNSKLIGIEIDEQYPLRATLRFAKGETLQVTAPPSPGKPGGRPEAIK